MTRLDRLLIRLACVAVILWLLGHWRPAPMITLTTPKQTTIKREIYAGLPPVGGIEKPQR